MAAIRCSSFIISSGRVPTVLTASPSIVLLSDIRLLVFSAWTMRASRSAWISENSVSLAVFTDDKLLYSSSIAIIERKNGREREGERKGEGEKGREREGERERKVKETITKNTSTAIAYHRCINPSLSNLQGLVHTFKLFFCRC